MLGASAASSFLGCKIHADCFAARTDRLVEAYSGQVLNEKFDISGSDEVLDT